MERSPWKKSQAWIAHGDRRSGRSRKTMGAASALNGASITRCEAIAGRKAGKRRHQALGVRVAAFGTSRLLSVVAFQTEPLKNGVARFTLEFINGHLQILLIAFFNFTRAGSWKKVTGLSCFSDGLRSPKQYA
ncbi:hypothetical protein [Desulfatiglans anilini]|uniref:hypothetical protein n=1 Tax=Desulfatiglans anilini TaxID=90728 RepID=UPI001FC98506|nr:hypothetical protein [Desulfatiglans anilini]